MLFFGLDDFFASSHLRIIWTLFYSNRYAVVSGDKISRIVNPFFAPAV